MIDGWCTVCECIHACTYVCIIDRMVYLQANLPAGSARARGSYTSAMAAGVIYGCVGSVLWVFMLLECWQMPYTRVNTHMHTHMHTHTHTHTPPPHTQTQTHTHTHTNTHSHHTCMHRHTHCHILTSPSPSLPPSPSPSLPLPFPLPLNSSHPPSLSSPPLSDTKVTSAKELARGTVCTCSLMAGVSPSLCVCALGS
jgi:hypothetical protein